MNQEIHTYKILETQFDVVCFLLSLSKAFLSMSTPYEFSSAVV